VHAQPELVLELLGRRLALGPHPQAQARRAFEGADEDLVPLARRLGLEVLDERAKVGCRRNLHGDLGELGGTADRGVADGIRGQLLVRDHEAGVVLGADERVHEADLLHHSRDAGDLDPVAEAQRLGHGDHQPGDEVAERALRSEAEDEAEDGRRGEQTAGHSADLGDHEQRREEADGHDRGRDRAAQHAVAGQCLRRAVGTHDAAIDHACGEGRQGKDDPDHEQALPQLHAEGIRRPRGRP
jgi:hypothetical protein